MSDLESDSVIVKEEPKDDDKDIVMTNSEMVLDDILGDDIIGESSGNYTPLLMNHERFLTR